MFTLLFLALFVKVAEDVAVGTFLGECWTFCFPNLGRGFVTMTRVSAVVKFKLQFRFLLEGI